MSIGMFNPFIFSTNDNDSEMSNNKYIIKKQIDADGNIYYQLNEITETLTYPVGDDIIFSIQNLRFDKKNTLQQIINSLLSEEEKINNSIELIQEQLNETIKITNFNELDIDTHEKDLDTIINELNNKNITENIIINGTLYGDALPQDTELYLDSAAVRVTAINDNNGNKYYKFEATSDKSSPYNWTSIYKNNELVMKWTSAYDGNAKNINDLQNQILSHVNNTDIHVSLEEKNNWNEKVSIIAEEAQECLTFLNNI